MTTGARRPTGHLLMLALLGIVGIAGLFVFDGAIKIVFFLATCWPVIAGVAGVVRHRRRA